MAKIGSDRKDEDKLGKRMEERRRRVGIGRAAGGGEMRCVGTGPNINTRTYSDAEIGGQRQAYKP